jgi:HSP20 family molecular chaperone IbpA
VQINGSQLSVSGIRRDWAVEEGCRSYRMEIAYSHFERTLELPVDLGDARINLECREGMLLVRIAMETRTP